jgi:hypothetical protein
MNVNYQICISGSCARAKLKRRVIVLAVPIPDLPRRILAERLGSLDLKELSSDIGLLCAVHELKRMKHATSSGIRHGILSGALRTTWTTYSM